MKSSFGIPSPWWVLSTLLLLPSPPTAMAETSVLKPEHEEAFKNKRSQFWRHHVIGKTLVIDGKDQYDNIEKCLHTKLTDEDREDLKTPNTKRAVQKRMMDEYGDGPVFLVELSNAITPSKAKAVQSLASCVREHLPHLYEERAMYKEMDLDEDPGLGGNCPTHLAPIISIFLPEVAKEMVEALQFAYEAAGWSGLVVKDDLMNITINDAYIKPEDAGMRASEHLTYSEFPRLKDHDDGSTAYTLNFALSGPDDYDGGFFSIKDHATGRRHYFKPPKYGALVFLGGEYKHSVTEIHSGHREMFSTEWWGHPDMPVGNSLWNAVPNMMQKYVKLCDEWAANRTKAGEVDDGSIGCQVPFPQVTAEGIDVKDLDKRFDPKTNKKIKIEGEDEEESEQKRGFQHNMEFFKSPLFQDLKSRPDFFRPEEEEPDFLIPQKIQPGELSPIVWRKDDTPIDEEGFVIGFPPELLQEFQKYVEASGMMDVARKLLYEDEPMAPNEHKIHKLNDGMNWGAMLTQWNTDMVWLDPGDEECFESLLAMLGRGGFDQVLETVGRQFNLDGLMVQGVGAIFLSEFTGRSIHVDIPGTAGTFYNIVVPVYIPENRTAPFKVANGDHTAGTINLQPNVGVVLGGDTPHGTHPVSYKDIKDFRLSFAIYVADVTEDNIEDIAGDSTSLWPTEGDTEWFWAQRGRLWKKDGSRSLKKDKGRLPLNVEDEDDDCEEHKDTCTSDPTGKRLSCARTCRVYLEDDVYFSMFPNSAFHKPSSASNKTSGECVGNCNDGGTVTISETK